MSRLDKDSHYQDLKQQPAKHILILGSGFAGIEVVKRVQIKKKVLIPISFLFCHFAKI
jgi:hypothetical protein